MHQINMWTHTEKEASFPYKISKHRNNRKWNERRYFSVVACAVCRMRLPFQIDFISISLTCCCIQRLSNVQMWSLFTVFAHINGHNQHRKRGKWKRIYRSKHNMMEHNHTFVSRLRLRNMVWFEKLCKLWNRWRTLLHTVPSERDWRDYVCIWKLVYQSKLARLILALRWKHRKSAFRMVSD